jgi:hypothetical protein
MSGVDAMVTAAEATLGLGEVSNSNYITRWYGLDNQPWCDMAVSYWAWHSNNQAAVCFNGKYSYTVAHAQAFRDHGEWHTDTAGIRRGDIVFFDWAGTNSISAIDHVGLVTSVSGADVHTIEGNISNHVVRSIRHAKFIAGYGRPSYTSPTHAGGPKSTPKQPALPWVSGKQVISAARSSSGYSGKSGTAAYSKDDTTRVQNALAKLGWIDFTGRGEFGPLTRDGYRRFQERLGYTGSAADGVPGRDSLTKLGAYSSVFRARDF